VTNVIEMSEIAFQANKFTKHHRIDPTIDQFTVSRAILKDNQVFVSKPG
jgi:hypothetical protein